MTAELRGSARVLLNIFQVFFLSFLTVRSKSFLIEHPHFLHADSKLEGAKPARARDGEDQISICDSRYIFYQLLKTQNYCKLQPVIFFHACKLQILHKKVPGILRLNVA
jgi:hypothetical protein